MMYGMSLSARVRWTSRGVIIPLGLGAPPRGAQTLLSTTHFWGASTMCGGPMVLGHHVAVSQDHRIIGPSTDRDDLKGITTIIMETRFLLLH